MRRIEAIPSDRADARVELLDPHRDAELARAMRLELMAGIGVTPQSHPALFAALPQGRVLALRAGVRWLGFIEGAPLQALRGYLEHAEPGLAGRFEQLLAPVSPAAVAHVRSLYVRAGARAGTATAQLLHAAFQHAARAGFRWVSLVTLDAEPRLQRLYRRLGGRELGGISVGGVEGRSALWCIEIAAALRRPALRPASHWPAGDNDMLATVPNMETDLDTLRH